jgi:hypothetical protein
MVWFKLNEVHGMSQDLPGPRCGQYVSGGIASYPCWLESGHEGPCEAVEVQASHRKRQEWLKTIYSPTPAPSSPSGPVPGVPSPPPALDPNRLEGGLQRQEEMLKSLHARDIKDLPDWVRQGIIANSSQISLALLWTLAQKEFSSGATTVTLSREFLDRLVIPVAQDFFSLFTISNQE